MDIRYSSYYPIIDKLRKKADLFFEKIKLIDNFEEKSFALQSLIELLVYHNTGVWTSSYIEKFYTDYAKTIDIEDYNIEYKQNSFLHVLTTGFSTGGHTRVVERWIKNAPNKQTHSVVFLAHNNEEMFELKKNVKEKNGECFYFDNSLSIQQKSLKLRELALKYEYIILHTHMEDVIPLIAFGTEKFTRPVLLYNHASMMFWLGKSISDMVLDIVNNDEITSIKRNIKNTFFLGVPSKEIIYSNRNKQELRKKLGIEENKKIIISSGALKKYFIIKNDSYANIIKKIIDEDTYCYLIGIPKNNKYWKNIKKQTKNHIIPLGYINFNEGYLDYLSSADLYIDSYPMSGGTTMIDAISRGVPALSIKTVDIQLDYFSSTSAYCNTEDEFIYKARKILHDEEFSKNITDELQKSLLCYQSINSWNYRVENLLNICPKNHSVKDFSNEKDYETTDDLSVLLNIMTDKNFVNNKSIVNKFLRQNYNDFIKYGINYHSKGIPYILEILSFKKSNKKTKIIKLLGNNIITF